MTTTRPRITIRSKLIIAFFLLVFTAVTAFILFSYHRTRNIMTVEIRKRGMDVTLAFTQMVKNYMLEMDFVTILDNARELIDNSDVLAVTVYSREGLVLVGTTDRVPVSMDSRTFYHRVFSGKKPEQRFIRRADQAVLESVSPVLVLNRVEYLLSIEMPLDVIEKELSESQRQIWIFAGFTSLLAFLLAVLLSRRITDPLRKLVTGAEEISR